MNPLDFIKNNTSQSENTEKNLNVDSEGRYESVYDDPEFKFLDKIHHFEISYEQNRIIASFNFEEESNFNLCDAKFITKDGFELTDFWIAFDDSSLYENPLWISEEWIMRNIQKNIEYQDILERIRLFNLKYAEQKYWITE